MARIERYILPFSVINKPDANHYWLEAISTPDFSIRPLWFTCSPMLDMWEVLSFKINDVEQIVLPRFPLIFLLYSAIELNEVYLYRQIGILKPSTKIEIRLLKTDNQEFAGLCLTGEKYS